MMCGALVAAGAALGADSSLCVFVAAAGPTRAGGGALPIIRAATGRAAPKAPVTVSVTIPSVMSAILARLERSMRPPFSLIPFSPSNHIERMGEGTGEVACHPVSGRWR